MIQRHEKPSQLDESTAGADGASDSGWSLREIGVPRYSSHIAAPRGRYQRTHRDRGSMQRVNAVGTSRKVEVDPRRADGVRVVRHTLREMNKIFAEATSGLLAFSGEAARINVANSLKEVS